MKGPQVDRPTLLSGLAAVTAGVTLVLAAQLYLGQDGPAPDAEGLLAYDAADRSPQEIARWIVDTYNCRTCHTLSAPGGFGLTDRGQELARDSEGCSDMLQTVWETLSIPESRWTAKQTRVRSNFSRFGCETCHRVGESSVELTEVGARAAALHMSCSGVMSALSR